MDPGSSTQPQEGTARVAKRRALTAASAICAELRDAIVALELEPGMPLSEKELTERFGVSRTPIREALIRLAEEGLVDIRPQAGTFVSRIPLSAIPEAVVVRQALEGALVEMAAARGGASGADRLDRVIERQAAFSGIDDRAAFHEADEAFHETIAALSGHPGVWRTVRQAKLQIDRCRRLTLPALGRMNQVISEHRVIADAVRRGDVGAARAAMQAHLQAVLPDARILARSHPAYFT
jgi:DNA-binding GntR family transcriptional regulator